MGTTAKAFFLTEDKCQLDDHIYRYLQICWIVLENTDSLSTQHLCSGILPWCWTPLVANCWGSSSSIDFIYCYIVLICIPISIVSTGEKKNDVHICPPLGADDDLSESRPVQSFASGDLCRLPEIRPCSANGRRRGGAGHCRWCQRQHLTGHNRSRYGLTKRSKQPKTTCWIQIPKWHWLTLIDIVNMCVNGSIMVQWCHNGASPSIQAIPAAKDARSSRDRIATPFVKDLLLAKETTWSFLSNMGVSENSVPLNPMVLLIIIPIKWL